MSSPCPICGRPVDVPAGALPAQLPPEFPFCSPRCRLLDLGRWLNGEYRIPGAPMELADGPAGEEGAPETTRAPLRRSGADGGRR
jgi:uncharacterized protein